MIPLYTNSRKKIFTSDNNRNNRNLASAGMSFRVSADQYQCQCNSRGPNKIGIYYNYFEIKAPFMSLFCLSTTFVIVYSSRYWMNSAPARVSTINFNNCMRQKLLWWRFRCNLMQITIKTIVIFWLQKHSSEFTYNPNWFW